MTDYQKYINALRNCAKEHDNDRTSTGHIIVSDLCRDTANLLEKADQDSKWIPVSERLPKYNKTVLISVKQKGKEAAVFTAQRRRRVKTSDIFECCTDYDGWWDFRIAAWDDHEVIAWMPLPEPYKESEEINE